MITAQAIPQVTEQLITESMLGVVMSPPVEIRDRADSWNRLCLELQAEVLPDLSDEAGEVDMEEETTVNLGTDPAVRTLEIPAGVYAVLRAYVATYHPGKGVLDVALEAIENKVGL